MFMALLCPISTDLSFSSSLSKIQIFFFQYWPTGNTEIIIKTINYEIIYLYRIFPCNEIYFILLAIINAFLAFSSE